MTNDAVMHAAPIDNDSMTNPDSSVCKSVSHSTVSEADDAVPDGTAANHAMTDTPVVHASSIDNDSVTNSVAHDAMAEAAVANDSVPNNAAAASVPNNATVSDAYMPNAM